MKLTIPNAAKAVLLGAITWTGASAQPVVVDGSPDEWADGSTGAGVRVDDARGDASGPTDVTALSARRAGGFVFLRLELASPANLQKPDRGGGLRIEIRGEQETVTLDTADRRVERDGRPVPWPELGYAALPTHAASDFEIRLRAPEGPLEISVRGSDTLDRTLRLSAEAAPIPARAVDVDRADTPLRVMVWNVRHGGPFGDRALEASGRAVLGTLEPDVLLLQEVWDVPGLAQRVREVCGDDWSVHEVGGVAVASRLPLTPLDLSPPVELDSRRRPAGGDSWSVMRNLFVGVDTPVGPVVMVSAHWKCCGSNGSEEDIQRMDDALVALKALWRLRDAAEPARPDRDGSMPHKADVPVRFTDAPVIIAGDYNLVGSRAPLDMLLTGGLEELVPLQSDEWNASTWRSPDDERRAAGEPVERRWRAGGFPPGRLDLAVVDRELNVTRSFIADLGRPTHLSDHLPIVIDVDEPDRR